MVCVIGEYLECGAVFCLQGLGYPMHFIPEAQRARGDLGVQAGLGAARRVVIGEPYKGLARGRDGALDLHPGRLRAKVPGEVGEQAMGLHCLEQAV